MTKWYDLPQRILSALVLLLIFFVTLFFSFYSFAFFCVVLGLIGLWELATLLRHTGRLGWGHIIAVIVIIISVITLIQLRSEQGPITVLLLILIVIGCDMGGYFGGRLIGGVKFCPKISPKKTWAGILSGWVGAVFLCGLATLFVSFPTYIFLVAIPLALASQLGDIAESVLKRQAKVKDSSSIIPGHGGVLDRFDGVAGAALLSNFLLM